MFNFDSIKSTEKLYLFRLSDWSADSDPGIFADVVKETVQNKNLNSKFYIIFLKVSLRVDDRILNWVWGPR